MLDELADINAKSADRSHGYVSRECWSTSQVADGRIRRSMARNIGQTSGAIPLIMGGQDMAEWVRHNFRSADGQEIKLVASSGTVVGAGDLSPDPPSVGPARDVTLSGSSIVWSLRTPNGRTGALLRITQLGCAYRAQRNEVITIPFARVGFDDVGAASTDFGDRKWPWPTLTLALSVDGVAVPEGITYTVGYWQEDARLHVSLPKSSRAIRKVAFLNEDEELVLVSPAKTMDFAWTRPGPTPTGTIEATLWWRLRLDGTRG